MAWGDGDYRANPAQAIRTETGSRTRMKESQELNRRLFEPHACHGRRAGPGDVRLAGSMRPHRPPCSRQPSRSRFRVLLKSNTRRTAKRRWRPTRHREWPTSRSCGRCRALTRRRSRSRAGCYSSSTFPTMRSRRTLARDNVYAVTVTAADTSTSATSTIERVD